MSEKKSPFIREYQRQSKSPWRDHSTVLLLADHQVVEDDDIELSFSRYIYQHRDSAGRILGMSISKSIQEENPELDSQYLEDHYRAELSWLAKQMGHSDWGMIRKIYGKWIKAEKPDYVNELADKLNQTY